MAENELIVTAGLNFQASESLILAQLKKIQDDFNSNGGLQINCTVNNDSLKAIQSQLSSLKQTLNVDINASHIQQSISQATKVEPVKINVTAEINKGELQRQAKEIEKALSIQYPKGQTQQLRDELKAYLSNYQKAIASNDLSGMETAIEKIAEFAGSYRKEVEIVNEELKYQQDRTREILKEQEKLYITVEQYATLQREVSKDGRTATQVLNSSIGVGRWSTDITKFDSRNLPYWSKFATEVNNINPLKDAILNEGDIVQGINDLNAFLSKSVDMTSQYLKANENTWIEWRDVVHDAVSVARGEGSSLSNEFVNLLGFEDITATEKNVQAMAEGMRTIQALKEQYMADTNVKNVTADWTKTAEGDLTGFTVNVQKATGEVERFRYEIDELNQVNLLGSSGSDRGIAQMFEKATKSADSLERKILNLKAAADDVSAPRPITSDESINKVSQAYNNASEAVQKLRTADASTFSELENQAKIAVDNLNNVIKAARNADTAATKLRAKPIETIKAEELSNLDKFTATISGSAIPNVENLIQKVETLREILGKVNDKQGLTDYLNRLTEVTADFKALEVQAKAVNKALGDLDKLSANPQFARNAQNPDVTSQLANIDALKAKYQQLFANIGNAKAPEDLQRISESLSQLKPEFDAVVQSSQNLSNQLKNDDASAKFGAKLNNLKNQVDIFANTNRRATESLRLMRDGETTFAQGFQNIRDALSNGNLDAAGLQRLTEQFRNFRGETDAAGLTVSRFFQSMQSQLRMVLQRWISLYAVIGYIRKMIDNVKELDNAMIDLRRVTDETDAGYQRFLEDANELARQMKTTTSSLVEMSYQWSKLGFEMNEALELSKASTIFMRVADVGQDQALSNLVTSLKAFRLEASQTMDVVDKLDKLNNEYAVSAAGLGDGLERSASAMAMSGNSLEETLAMLTGAGEIVQNLENTGNGIKILSLRLRGMKGALEELNEPVDDLMEVSKIQTQILNLTHNQVNIFDEATQEFRSTYDIMKDISDIWDSLSSTSRANLTEILFGKQRANIGLALIQAFQSGQVQSAFEDATNAAGTATEEYGKMMQGIQAQFDAFKGAFQEFSNAFINSDLLKGLVKFGTQFIKFLTTATDKVGSLVVVLTPILMYFGGKTGTNIFSAIINGLKGLVAAETGAITATGAFTVAWKTMVGALSGFAIGAIIAGISYVADKLIVTSAETEASIKDITSAVGDLANATEELEKSQTDIENIAQSYSKIATTVGDVNERKTQLLELQNQLSDKFKDEADGIDLVNGKYSEQIKKMKELAEEQRRQYEIENADKIAEARRLANLRVEEPTYVSAGNNLTSPNGYYDRIDDKKGDRALFTLKGLNKEAMIAATNIEGVYRASDFAGVYLSGTLEDARNQLKQIIDNYSKLRDVDSETLEKLTARYKELNDALNDIKEVTPYIEDVEFKPVFTGIFDGLSDAVNQAVSDVTMQPFYDKLDEAQDKLKQLANPSDLTIAEYDTLYKDVQKLEGELYKMAGDSEDSKQAVVDLFNGFKQGISENGDHLEQFMEQFNTTLEDSFKKVAETVTGVQDAMNKLAEGKGLSHSEAWKLLKEDTDGYLQSIKLVNGEYYLSQEELIKFKDAKIKASIDELKASNEQYTQERENLLKQLDLQKEELKLAKAQFELDVLRGKINSQSDYEYMKKAVTDSEIAISETENSIKRCNDLWTRNNYLIEELNQNLGETRTLSLATETELNNAVKALENEVKAVDDTIDSLNDRKELIEKEKSALQEELELLNEQKATIEETIKNYDAVADAVSEYTKEQIDGIQSQIDALEEERKAIEDYYNNQIDALKEQNEERDDAIKKEKALADLANAQNQKRRVYSSARGWTYETSKEDVVQAQNALAEIESEEQIKKLEKERDSRLGGFDDRKKEYETQIKAFEEYSEKYSSIASDIQKAENALLADQILGSNWREQIEQKDEKLLTKYRFEYQQFNSQLKNLVNNEISTLQASIDAKDKEIKMIDNEIKAYNNYKDIVQTKLGEAKTELENYKNNVADYCGQISDSFYHMQDEIWNNHNKIIGWFGAVAAAARSMRDEIGTGAVGGAMMGLHLAGFANGGVVDSTGLAMLHGTKQKGEVIFNAADSKKLYDLVHGTPSLIANIAKQAGQITGFNSTKVSNTNANSINVNIGQVVANNPQELTRNLDTHLDSYFRRKLTQSYTQ